MSCSILGSKQVNKMINRRSAQFLIISVVVPFAACSGTPETKSAFLSSFSAKDAIEKSYQSPTGAQGSTESGGESMALSGNRRSYHRSDRAELTISERDEPSFLPRIKDQIEQQIRSSGGQITGTGSGGGSFSIGYTDGTARGWIDIWGVRRTGDSYYLVITITEF